MRSLSACLVCVCKEAAVQRISVKIVIHQTWISCGDTPKRNPFGTRKRENVFVFQTQLEKRTVILASHIHIMIQKTESISIPRFFIMVLHLLKFFIMYEE